ncbi:hypothetical protein QKW60_05680 [Defluviimonas aestuarii]|nr:hypothetical protein [Defluviimonas aestuarii]MDI3335887.1 hypothetical protein [Defluviimonas aestuarii]
MKLLWRAAARYYAVRAKRARARADRFALLSEKFFARIKGVW